ncbi:PH domain-containing protein [Streptomyces sp. NPDC059009]|uniref:PH domain-containing protein n=1 Tax=Streptomyces sp. NPDC059009 TaxID=3346694 RepID=UPI0036B5A3A6
MQGKTIEYGLRPPAHAVDRRAVTWWTLQAALVSLGGLACAAGASAGLWWWLSLSAGVIGGVGAGLVLLAAAFVVVVPRWRYRVHRWEATGEAVYTVSGSLWRLVRIAPMARIQTVDTARGPLQQLLGLSTLVVTTASAAGPVRVHGLGRARAEELAARLAAAAQAAEGDGAA